ncbi:MAG: hypothetical protein ACOC0S_02255, partial [Desulfohalobiaceae bacterium]
TVLVVSHDRQFLENVVSSTLVFQGQGHVVEYAGAVPNWEQLGKESGPESRPKTQKKAAALKKEPQARPRRLTFAQARELERLPEEIEARKKNWRVCIRPWLLKVFIARRNLRLQRR